MNWITEFLSEENKKSSTRLMMVLVFLAILMRYAAFNIADLVAGRGGFDFTWTDLSVLSIVLSGKLIQKVSEKK